MYIPSDQVVVISGKDKGKKGKITAAFPKTGKVVVEGVNMVTKHQKARNAMQPGGIVHKEGSHRRQQRDARVPQVRQGYPCRPQGRRR